MSAVNAMLRHRYGAWSSQERASLRSTTATAAAPFRNAGKVLGRGFREVGQGFRRVMRPLPGRDLSEPDALSDEEIARSIQFVPPDWAWKQGEFVQGQAAYGYGPGESDVRGGARMRSMVDEDGALSSALKFQKEAVALIRGLKQVYTTWGSMNEPLPPYEVTFDLTRTPDTYAAVRDLDTLASRFPVRVFRTRVVAGNADSFSYLFSSSGWVDPPRGTIELEAAQPLTGSLPSSMTTCPTPPSRYGGAAEATLRNRYGRG